MSGQPLFLLQATVGLGRISHAVATTPINDCRQCHDMGTRPFLAYYDARCLFGRARPLTDVCILHKISRPLPKIRIGQESWNWKFQTPK